MLWLIMSLSTIQMMRLIHLSHCHSKEKSSAKAEYLRSLLIHIQFSTNFYKPIKILIAFVFITNINERMHVLKGLEIEDPWWNPLDV